MRSNLLAALFFLVLASSISGQEHSLATVTPAETVTGELSEQSGLMPDSTRYEIWNLNTVPGQRLRISLSSSDFDAYLIVARRIGGGLEHLIADDDGAGGTNASLRTTIGEGEYVAIVNTLFAGESGRYTLTVEEDVDAASLARFAVLGQSFTGALDGSASVLPHAGRYQDYRFAAAANERIAASVRTTGFLPYVWVGRMVDGSFQRLQAAESLEGHTTRLDVAVSDSGEYVLRIGTSDSLNAGAFGVSLVSLDSLWGNYRVAVEQVRHNEEVAGVLSRTSQLMEDGTYYRDYSYNAIAGERVLVDLKSPDFDSYLLIGHSSTSGFEVLAENDDNAQSLDATLVYTFPAAGPYIIRVNSATPAEGNYTLRVQRVQR